MLNSRPRPSSIATFPSNRADESQGFGALSLAAHHVVRVREFGHLHTGGLAAIGIELEVDASVDATSRLLVGQGFRSRPRPFSCSLFSPTRDRGRSRRMSFTAFCGRTRTSWMRTFRISWKIRAALHDSSREPKFMRTLHGYGYAFAGDQAPEEPLRERAATSYWLSFGDEQLPLRAGENIVGRTIAADVRLDVVGVSRRHACILIIDGEVFVEDGGSKNGTFVKGQRITSRQRLAPDEEVAFASTRVTLRVESPSEPTETILAAAPVAPRRLSSFSRARQNDTLAGCGTDDLSHLCLQSAALSDAEHFSEWRRVGCFVDKCCLCYTSALRGERCRRNRPWGLTACFRRLKEKPFRTTSFRLTRPVSARVRAPVSI